jgi:membrane associated rhomboid family serine protease
MELRLSKTFLSKRPTLASFVMSCFVLTIMLLLFGVDEKSLSANGYQVFEKKEYWRAFTTTFLHGDLDHLAHNAFFFTGLAALLNNYFGFWVFPILSFVMGGFINMATLKFYPPMVNLVGVSGVIYFMAAFWLTLYLFIERRQSITVRIVHAVAVSLIFLFPEVFQPQTSYLAHGLGFLFGLPVGLAYYFLNKKNIRAKDQWVEIKKVKSPMDDIILLESGEFVLLNQSEEEKDFPESVI